MSTPIDPFHTMGVSRIAHALKAAGRSVIHMEFGQPSTGAPAAAIAEAHRVLDRDGMGYWESPALKARIARHYGERYDLDLSPERILLTCGASPGLVVALSAGFRPGDRIGVARPGYVAYRNAIRALKLEPVEIACGAETGFQLTADRIAQIDPPPQGMIIASPANPTGAIIPGPELARIAEACRARGARIISDEIYHGLSYGEPERCMLSFAPDAVVINSFSKYFSMAAWRLGWMVAPEAEVEHYRAYAANLFLTAPSLSQHAALIAMDCRDELEANLEVYARNRRILLDALPGLGIEAIAPPDGAFYIYADVGRMTDDSLAFCQAMVRETGVAAATGLDFDPVEGRRFVRFSFAVSTAEVLEAIGRLRPWFAARRAAAQSPAPRRRPDERPLNRRLSPLSGAGAHPDVHGRRTTAGHRQEVVVDHQACQWVTIERCGVAPGDLVSAEAGGLPIYRVLSVQDQRAWLRDERTGRDHIAPLATLRWKLAS